MRVDETMIWLAAFGFPVVIGILIFSAARHREQQAVRRALIDKFGSAQDLGEFLQSEGGRRFLADLSTGASGPLASVLASVQKGVVILLMGVGCVGASAVTGRDVVMAIGLILIFVAVGFLVSAAVTYRLSKSWGLLGK